jgi:hypothetical protein
MTEAQLNEVVAEVKRRSSIDPEYRALAVKDGGSAIAKVTNQAVPGGLSFRFVDNTGPVKTVVLPEAMANVEELSDVELEQVAGGDVGVTVTWRR